MPWTRQSYEEYQKAVEGAWQGFEAVSTGACFGCEKCREYWDEEEDDDSREMLEEGFFSNCPCFSCNSHLGGQRYPAHGIPIPGSVTEEENGNLSQGEIVHFDICSDCVYYLNYGRLDDMSMLEPEKEEA